MSPRGARSGPTRRHAPAPADRACAEHWLGHLLNRTGVLLRDRVGEALRPFGITPRAFGLLLEVGRGDGHGQVELARRLGFDRTTMSQLVEELRSLGWIQRDTLEEDRRVNTLCLTARGQQRLRDAIAAAAAVEREFAACLDARAVEDLRAALQALLAHARDDGGAPRPARGARRRGARAPRRG